ncbi:DUF3105 domain-containing protein [Streptomyces sp. CB01881]|uniref:DUF3105 domain-containing protein n=1 Tax=Streptomyces sp. CB01881 TaxID=2078691 RepID=UPI000CDBE551|nr:DUF3105 domain-containing protein [Streptomyces sp. CB01881]AUY52280.1 hypothetical protein C2142_28910 [Streptomyces sp. CB01881]TYC71702.1 DUF3105 domain-containing protein [Streptomyces sp. CB01881]
MGSASKQSNKPGGKQGATDRRARIAELRAAEQRRDRRNKIVASVIAGVLVIGAIATGTWIVVDANNDKKAKEAAANAPIDGVKTFGDLSRNHVKEKVNYPMTPPVGGDHNAIWLDCMGHVYDQPVENERAVHSLEHGAVWVTYNGKATPDDIKTLSDKVKGTPYSLMSPYPDEQGTITLNAWSTQLVVDNANDPRVAEFFTKYVQGKQTQEPGASCTMGSM